MPSRRDPEPAGRGETGGAQQSDPHIEAGAADTEGSPAAPAPNRAERRRRKSVPIPTRPQVPPVIPVQRRARAGRR